MCVCMLLEISATISSSRPHSDMYVHICRSQSEIAHHKAKQELVEREASKASATTDSPSALKPRKPQLSSPSRREHWLSGEAVLREVWVQQAWMLIKEVCVYMYNAILQLVLKYSWGW